MFLKKHCWLFDELHSVSLWFFSATNAHRGVSNGISLFFFFSLFRLHECKHMHWCPAVYRLVKKQQHRFISICVHFTHLHACIQYTHTDDQSCEALTCSAESLFCELGTELFISRLIMPMHMVITAVVVSFRVGGRSYRYKLILKQPDHKELSKAHCSFLCIHKQAGCVQSDAVMENIHQTNTLRWILLNLQPFWGVPARVHWPLPASVLLVSTWTCPLTSLWKQNTR